MENREVREPEDAKLTLTLRLPEERPGVCHAHGRCPGLWCRIMRRCFQHEGI